MSRYKLVDNETNAWSASYLCDIVNNNADLALLPPELKDPLARGHIVFMDNETPGVMNVIRVTKKNETKENAQAGQHMVLFGDDLELNAMRIAAFNNRYQPV